MRAPLWIVSCVLLFGACGERDESPAQAKKVAADPGAVAGAPAAKAPAPPEFEDPTDPNEACAQIVAVAWAGAAEAPEDITRDEAAAKARAEALRGKATAPGADLRALARSESDAKSRERGGAIGTFAREDWPEKHAAIADAVFGLRVGETSELVRAPYGFTFARRCKVEKVHTRHILIRYDGAQNAPDDLRRTKSEAEALVRELHAKATAAGADFAALARDHSEDGSAERGGDLGVVGRGLFVPPYEDAAFALAPGATSSPVETKYGFHVIQRVE